jgi:hypothetical protein
VFTVFLEEVSVVPPPMIHAVNLNIVAWWTVKKTQKKILIPTATGESVVG